MNIDDIMLALGQPLSAPPARSFMPAMSVPTTPVNRPALTSPSAGIALDNTATSAPPWMGLDPNMTPIQMRTSIASKGLGGDGRYANSDAGNFWRSLIRRGQEIGFSLFPIEEQYARNTLGIAPQGTESLLSAI